MAVGAPPLEGQWGLPESAHKTQNYLWEPEVTQSRVEDATGGGG